MNDTSTGTDDSFGDRMVEAGRTDLPERFFDRFVFNLHPTDATVPSIVFGHGIHPVRDVADGFAIASLGDEQRNLRWSTELSASDWDGAGPFRFEVTEPMRSWRLTLDDNPSGVAFDLTWTARTPAWWSTVKVSNDDAEPTVFDHLVQSGRYAGWLSIDGQRHDVENWWGQRDRSRGVRTMSGGQGLHMWVQAQLPTMSVGLLQVENRDHEVILIEGAVMHEDGRLDPITLVRHDLEFDDDLDLRGGRLEVTTSEGEVLLVDCDASARGGYLAGGGYGGHHGRGMGRDHLEHDRYPLDGTMTPRSLDSALTDRLTRFLCNDEDGSGIFEFAHSRSPRYTYRPSMA